MIDYIEHLKTSDAEYPMAMTFNVLEAIQNKYGTVEKWKSLMLGIKSIEVVNKKEEKEDNQEIILNDFGEINIPAMKFFVLESINEGIDIENEKLDEKRKFVTDKQVGRIISEVGENVILQIITALSNKSNGESEEENTEKN